MAKTYYEFEVGNKSLRLRIRARQAAQLEKVLGCSPLTLFIKMTKNTEDELSIIENLPSIDVYATILNAALQAYEHGYDMNKTYELIDEFIDDGHSQMELMNVVSEILKVSGYMPQEQEEVEEKPHLEVVEK